jgi:hypothetical protein
MTWYRMLLTLRCAFWLAAAFCVASIGRLALATAQAECAIAATVQQLGLTLPARADARLGSIQDSVLELVDNHARKIEAQLAGAVKDADSRIAGIQDLAQGQLTRANDTLARVPGIADDGLRAIAGDVHAVAVPAASVVSQVNDAAPDFLDCSDANPSCLFNRWQGISWDTEQTLRAWAKTAPEMSAETAQIEKHFAGIAADVHKEADELTKPKRWYQRLEAYVMLGARVGAALL